MLQRKMYVLFGYFDCMLTLMQLSLFCWRRRSFLAIRISHSPNLNEYKRSIVVCSKKDMLNHKVGNEISLFSNISTKYFWYLIAKENFRLYFTSNVSHIEALRFLTENSTFYNQIWSRLSYGISKYPSRRSLLSKKSLWGSLSLS